MVPEAAGGLLAAPLPPWLSCVPASLLSPFSLGKHGQGGSSQREAGRQVIEGVGGSALLCSPCLQSKMLKQEAAGRPLGRQVALFRAPPPIELAAWCKCTAHSTQRPGLLARQPTLAVTDVPLAV